jgi:predicted transcriptional regulator
MAAKFEEVLPVRLPKGARQELMKIADRRYQSACAIARQAIMAEIEKARQEMKPAA